MLIQTTRDLKTALRQHKYAWPGGYPTFFITSDGASLSHEAVRDNLRSILESIKHNQRDGWKIEALDVNWEDPDLICDHTGDRIESAYAEDDIILTEDN